jgi:hypothetical protein
VSFRESTLMYKLWQKCIKDEALVGLWELNLSLILTCRIGLLQSLLVLNSRKVKILLVIAECKIGLNKLKL